MRLARFLLYGLFAQWSFNRSRRFFGSDEDEADTFFVLGQIFEDQVLSDLLEPLRVSTDESDHAPVGRFTPFPQQREDLLSGLVEGHRSPLTRRFNPKSLPL